MSVTSLLKVFWSNFHLSSSESFLGLKYVLLFFVWLTIKLITKTVLYINLHNFSTVLIGWWVYGYADISGNLNKTPFPFEVYFNSRNTFSQFQQIQRKLYGHFYTIQALTRIFIKLKWIMSKKGYKTYSKILNLKFLLFDFEWPSFPIDLVLPVTLTWTGPELDNNIHNRSKNNGFWTSQTNQTQ